MHRSGTYLSNVSVPAWSQASRDKAIFLKAQKVVDLPNPAAFMNCTTLWTYGLLARYKRFLAVCFILWFSIHTWQGWYRKPATDSGIRFNFNNTLNISMGCWNYMDHLGALQTLILVIECTSMNSLQNTSWMFHECFFYRLKPWEKIHTQISESTRQQPSIKLAWSFETIKPSAWLPEKQCFLISNKIKGRGTTLQHTLSPTSWWSLQVYSQTGTSQLSPW